MDELDNQPPPVIDESVPKRSRKTAVTINGKTVYLNNKELLAEIRVSKEAGQMSDKLARMLQLLCSRYARRGNFVNYSYNSDMQAYAMMVLVKVWGNFDLEKGNNPFAFYTQCIKNSFRQYLNEEREQRDVRDQELINQGLNPSYGYQTSSRDSMMFEDEQDYDATYVSHTETLDNHSIDDAIDLIDDVPTIDTPPVDQPADDSTISPDEHDVVD